VAKLIKPEKKGFDFLNSKTLISYIYKIIQMNFGTFTMVSTKVMMLGHPIREEGPDFLWIGGGGGGPKELGNHLELSSLIYNYKRVPLLLVSSKPRDRPSDIMFGF
jgi:hypothetical protein